MASIFGQVRDRQLIVDIAVGDYEVSTLKPKTIVPKLNVFRARGLIDTGAQASLINSLVIRELALIQFGKKDIVGIGGNVRTKTYLAAIGFFAVGSSDNEIGLTETPYFVGEERELAWMPENERYDVIVGMDVLAQCDLFISRGGQATITLY